MKEIYFESIMAIERLHQLFLEVIKVELDRMHIQDISNVQCFILYNIGDSQLTVGEITNRGYYLGSNVTYNLKKMVDYGYLIQEQSFHDKRSSHIKLSEKGMTLFKRFDKILTAHSQNIKHNSIGDAELKTLRNLLQKLEAFWNFTLSHEVKF